MEQNVSLSEHSENPTEKFSGPRLNQTRIALFAILAFLLFDNRRSSKPCSWLSEMSNSAAWNKTCVNESEKYYRKNRRAHKEVLSEYRHFSILTSSLRDMALFELFNFSCLPST